MTISLIIGLCLAMLYLAAHSGVDRHKINKLKNELERVRWDREVTDLRTSSAHDRIDKLTVDVMQRTCSCGDKP